MSTWLWDELHEFFDTDDGSLPEVHIDYSDPHAVPRGFALLLDRSRELVADDGQFWSKAAEEARPVNSVSNAATARRLSASCSNKRRVGWMASRDNECDGD